MKTAIITGVSGQDGSYMADLLVSKGYRVIGTTRSTIPEFPKNIRQLQGKIDLVCCNYSRHSVSELVKDVNPDEIYNFTGQSYVGKSWGLVEETLYSVCQIPCYFLESIITHNPSIKYFQASSSEILSLNEDVLTEESSLNPSNPYGCTKAFAYNMINSYKRQYDIFAVNAIYFGHESIRRNIDFLSVKLINGAINIKNGRQDTIQLGGLDLVRDWGYAPEYIDAAYKMMQHDTPDNLVICTGVGHSVQDMIEVVFSYLDLDWEKHIISSEENLRPNEVKKIIGSNKKAAETINWQPKVSFEEMLEIIIKESLHPERRKK